MNDELTLADHAEKWCEEQGGKVPQRNTKEWDEMYTAWIEYAFEDFTE